MLRDDYLAYSCSNDGLCCKGIQLTQQGIFAFVIDFGGGEGFIVFAIAAEKGSDLVIRIGFVILNRRLFQFADIYIAVGNKLVLE